LNRVAQVMDSQNGDHLYQDVCKELVAAFDDPELTYSARILKALKQQGVGNLGLELAEKYRQMLVSEPLEVLDESALLAEQDGSWHRQRDMEAGDTLSLEDYLAAHAGGTEE